MHEILVNQEFNYTPPSDLSGRKTSSSTLRQLPQVPLHGCSGSAAPIFGTQANTSIESCPLLDLYPSKACSPRQMKTPVMHPNLVCTLKSILSPQISLALETQMSPREDTMGQYRQLALSQYSVFDSMHGYGQGISLSADSTRLALPSSPSWPNDKKVSKVQGCSRKPSEEAVLVSVDLIQNRRPYQCAFTGCQKTFKNPQTMKMHHKTHFTDTTVARLGADALSAIMPMSCLKAGYNKKIPSRCPACNKTFVGLYELRRHFGRKHSEGEKSHACRKCGKKFYIEVDVRDHEKLCGEAIVCSCGMRFAFKCNLVAHKRSHPKCQDRAGKQEEMGATLVTNQQSLNFRIPDEQGEEACTEVGLQSLSCNSSIHSKVGVARHQSPPLQPLCLFDSTPTFPLFLSAPSLSTSVMQSIAEKGLATSPENLTPDSYYFAHISGVLEPHTSTGHSIDEQLFSALSRPTDAVPQRPRDQHSSEQHQTRM